MAVAARPALDCALAGEESAGGVPQDERARDRREQLKDAAARAEDGVEIASRPSWAEVRENFACTRGDGTSSGPSAWADGLVRGGAARDGVGE